MSCLDFDLGVQELIDWVGFDDRMSFLGGGRACMYVFILLLFLYGVLNLLGTVATDSRQSKSVRLFAHCLNVDIDHCSFIEIIVTMLLDNFKFSLSDDEIVWKLANIQMPWVEGQEAKGPSMPLTVERI